MSSRNFDGTDDDITFSTGLDLDSLAPYTMTAWALTDTVAAGNRVIGGCGIAASGWQVIVRLQGSTLYHYYSRSTGAVGASMNGGTFVVGTWHFVAATFDGTDIGLFLDGVAIGTPDSPPNTRNDGSDGEWGDQAEDATSERWNGRIAHGHWWDRELSLNEILQVMNSSGSIQNGLKIFHPLNGLSDPEVDLSGNNNNATVTGATHSAQSPPISSQFIIPTPMNQGAG